MIQLTSQLSPPSLEKDCSKCGAAESSSDQSNFTKVRMPMLSRRWLPAGKRMTVKQLLGTPRIPDPRWDAWFKLAGAASAKPQFVAARFPNYELEALAAMQGIGAALLSPDLFSPLIAQGKLLVPFAANISGPSSYWLLSTEEFADPHFLGWMRSHFTELNTQKVQAVR